ncbi:hypothetical protein [Polyangium sp. 6x1]|uniref:hypothetical protein n=1 Tax=Polyangium sp. 6x1 TaxID=3042689 RepID=UPI00248216F8|nr:hypothetical protein [Polyangium sp. 6x1]MDI1450447.1 hypothetical protein [Polyangium sp. 6x1]
MSMLIASCVLLAFALAGLVWMVARYRRTTEAEIEARKRAEALENETRALGAKLHVAVEEDKKKVGWLDHQEQEILWLRAELEKRPKITRKTYKILTLGVKATGKTSLTLKWANPLIDLGVLAGTKIDRYERTVSHVSQKDVVMEHVFEVGDWGGEHIVDAQQELIGDEIHGLLIVVDLGGKDAKKVEPARIQEQLQEFQPQALKFFFGPKTVASCKTVVLFINKSDLLSGTPLEVEEQAKKLYAPLIENLMKYSMQLDIRVFVGSANYGHSTHLLFSHFVERILPKHAYDAQLLQRMVKDFSEAPKAEKPEKTVPLPAVSATSEPTKLSRVN